MNQEKREKCNVDEFHKYVMYYVQTIRYSTNANTNKMKVAIIHKQINESKITKDSKTRIIH